MKRVKVWDLVVRATHGLFGLLVLGAFSTAEEDALTWLHTRLGLVLLGVVLLRVVWGVVGSRHARFSDFVRSPRAIRDALRQMVRGAPRHFLGHNPVAGVMVVTLLVTLLVVTVSGVLLLAGPEWNGPLALSKAVVHWLQLVHHGASSALPVLLVLHVAGVVLSSVLERQNLVLSMVTGFKDAPADDEGPSEPARSRRVAGFLVAVLTGSTTIGGLWWLLPVAPAEAASPLLSVYERRAQAEGPGFSGFDSARGRALFLEPHETSSGRTSCATCHTEDPTRPGRSPAGKQIEPLAPAANPERFSDLSKADKWFDRNCKQVLGRRCSAQEQGDVLVWLQSL